MKQPHADTIGPDGRHVTLAIVDGATALRNTTYVFKRVYEPYDGKDLWDACQDRTPRNNQVLDNVVDSFALTALNGLICKAKHIGGDRGCPPTVCLAHWRHMAVQRQSASGWW